MRDRKDYTIGLDDGLDRYHDASSNALARISEDGLDLPDDRPRHSNGKYFDGRLPNNVSSLSAAEIGELYNLLTCHNDYVTGRITIAKAAVRNAEERLKLTKAKVRKTKAGNAQEREDATLCDERYVSANADCLEAKEYCDLLTGIEVAAARDGRVVSRIIEVRKLELGQGRRDVNIERDRFKR